MAASPRSRRVGIVEFSQLLDSPPSSPPIPARSPLRPRPQSRSFAEILPTPPPSEGDQEQIQEQELDMPLSFQMRNRSFPSLKGLADVVDAQDPSKPLPLRPVSLLIMDEDSTSPASSLAQTPTLTKRQHVLHELLASERAYASDLALIREVHIPLALGHPVPLHGAPITPPHSSASSSRTLSTASDLSTTSLGPPMTLEDTKIIFSNITELAIFSDMFCDSLEEALGSVVEGGQGDDRVGALFLDIIPDLERPYKYYITRQASADEHLQSLRKTPALEAYYAQTRTLATSISHAWDLHSLLIKPVQRLLKYPLLLAAILDETPDGHPDKENLRLARQKIEEVARNVNEERRRAEVVKGVLLKAGAKKSTGNINIGVAASVNLSKMKSLRKNPGMGSSLAGGEGSEEAARVEKMQRTLKEVEAFAEQFARNVSDWCRAMGGVVVNLGCWAASFGKVIGLSEDQGSEAFDAFVALVDTQLRPLCGELEAVIQKRLFSELALLLKTMDQPLKLLASMNEQEPFHYHLLNMNVSAKNRPPPALLEASTNYLALRGQLAAELPQYITLLHRGLAFIVRKLAEIQTQFWLDVRDRWGDLWEMLRVEGEMNAGADETIAVWHARWSDVDDAMVRLSINNSRKIYQEPVLQQYHREQQYQQQYYRDQQLQQAKSSHVASLTSNSDAASSPQMKRSASAGVANALGALEPVRIPRVSSPLPLSPSSSSRSRTRGTSDASASKRSLGRRSSVDSLKSGKSKGKSMRAQHHQQQRPSDDFGEYVAVMSVPPLESLDSSSTIHPISIPRTKSMPLPKSDIRPSTSSSTRSVLVPPRDDDNFEADERGRHSRKPSFRRRISDTLQRNQSSSRHRNKSPSNTNPFLNTDYDHSASTPPMPSTDPRSSWSKARSKYLCRVIQACRPPAAVTYFSFPFFTLVEGDVYEVLQEAGHPGAHPKLPLYVDDGPDCLLLCRDEPGNVGWALASFLEPLSM